MKNINSHIVEIKNDNDLEIAFLRIDDLIDKMRSSKDNIEFNNLATLIEEYENIHYPIVLSS